MGRAGNRGMGFREANYKQIPGCPAQMAIIAKMGIRKTQVQNSRQFSVTSHASI
jgi:hypothetical protein